VPLRTGLPPFARVQLTPSDEVAMKIAGPEPSSAVPEYHITYVEPTFAIVGSSTLSLSPTAAAAGLSTGLAPSSVSGRSVDGSCRLAPAPVPLVVSVRTPTGPNVVP